MSYEKELFNEVIYIAAGKLSPSDTSNLLEWVESLEVGKLKADEYEAKNKELLEELKYLRKVNNDLVWQRDTDEEHEAKAKAWDKYKTHMESHIAGEINEEELVSDLKSDYFESGETNA